jgi:hypothetical protein
MIRAVILGDFSPRVALPILSQDNDSKLSRDVFATTNDVTHFCRELLSILIALKQPVVLRVS